MASLRLLRSSLVVILYCHILLTSILLHGPHHVKRLLHFAFLLVLLRGPAEEFTTRKPVGDSLEKGKLGEAAEGSQAKSWCYNSSKGAEDKKSRANGEVSHFE